jgi:LuxR family transcriptional regulator, maltose regulon positive regulatory protein
MLTRVDPQLPLGRLRVAGDLVELREQDLRFTGGEAAELFERLLPGGLDAELVGRLEPPDGGLGGGPADGRDCAGARGGPARVVDAFAGSHRFVVDYLVEEAVGRQTEAVQRFLMETSILEPVHRGRMRRRDG